MRAGVAERIYYGEQERLEFSARVTEVRQEGKGRWGVALDRTAFYPESGGQPWDLGTIVTGEGEVPVVAVVEEDGGEIWHVVGKPVEVGVAVSGRVDGRRRRDHMQQHTGQHLLSAVFLRELGAGTVSFHLGGESSTIDLAVGALTAEDVVRVEEAVNGLVGEDRLVSVTAVERGAAEMMRAHGMLRKLPEREGSIRVVEIEGVEWNACGGTHVGSTGRIGGLTVRKVERVKQGVRVEFCCGLRAVRAARRDFEVLGEVGGMLSTGAWELPTKVGGMLDEARAGVKARRGLLEEMAGLEARGLVGEGRVVEVEARDGEYAKLLAGRCAGLRADGVAIVTAKDGERGTVVVAAGGLAGVDCGAVMKGALVALGARGGGSAGMAQGGVGVGQVEELVRLVRLGLG